MSRLIKFAEGAQASSVRGLSRTDEAPDPVSSQVALLELEIESLSEQLAKAQARIPQLEAEREAAYHAGEAAGREVGRKEGDRSRIERLATLSRGIEQAQVAYGAQIALLEYLAPLLARTGLAKVLGDADAYTGLMSEAIGRQLRELDARTVLRVMVSARDFPTQVEREDLEAMLDRPEVALSTSDDLAPGDCRIELTLGTLDIGLGGQWDKLCAALAEAAQPDRGRSR